jgi:transcriptional regulator with XRE-family HTH domain
LYAKYVELKNAKGVTDYRVSVDTGISRSTFSEWKSGRSKPKIVKLMKLALYFNVPIEFLLEEGSDNLCKKDTQHNVLKS